MKFLQLFKDLHGHLYTAIPAKESVLNILKYLDKIKIYPPEFKNVKAFEKSIKTAKKLGMEIGIEIPSIAFNEEIVSKYGIFLNLNVIIVYDNVSIIFNF